MIKKFLFLTLALLILIGFSPILGKEDYTKDWELSKEDIKDALDLGRILSRWEEFQNLFLGGGLYTLCDTENDSIVYSDCLDIYTPFRTLVENSMMYFYVNGVDLPEEDINEILSRNELKIFFLTYGYEENFANNYICFIRVDNKIILPVNIYISEPVKLDTDWYEPKFRNSITFIFPLNEIPKKLITIIVIKDKKIKNYQIDLGKLK